MPNRKFKIFAPDKRLNPKLCKTKSHLWTTIWYSKNEIGEICKRCEERRERKPTREERKRYTASTNAMLRKAPEIHKLCHAFERNTIKKGLKGYDLMLAAERWEKKYPDRIMETRVDDAHFTGSSLVFVTHEDHAKRKSFEDDGELKPHWMGISVYYVPQNSAGRYSGGGIEPVQFFLYPGHLHGLIATLKKLERRMRTFPNVQREDRLWRQTMRKRRKPRRKKRKEPSWLWPKTKKRGSPRSRA